MERTKCPVLFENEEKEFKYNHFQEPIILSKGLIDTLKYHEKFSDLIALYVFYYYTAKWQQTNKPKATTGYTANGLNWSEFRVRQMKKILEEMKLVKSITKRDENNKIVGHYIYVRFIWSNEKINNLHPISKATVWEKLPYGETHRVELEGGNALSKDSKLNKKINKKEIIFPFNNSPKFISTWNEWLLYKSKEFGFKYKSDISENAAINKLVELSGKNESIAICIIKQSIANRWAGLFPLTNNKQTNHQPKNGHIDLNIRETYITTGQI